MELRPVWIDGDLQRSVKVAAALTDVSMRYIAEAALLQYLASDERTQDLVVAPAEEEPTPCPKT